MIIKYSKFKGSNNNVTVETLPLSLISNEGEGVSNLSLSLEATLFNDNEFSDEEWLKAKHRILDSRIKYRNLMNTINNATSHL